MCMCVNVFSLYVVCVLSVWGRYSGKAHFLSSLLCVYVRVCVCVCVCIKVPQKGQSVSSAFLRALQNNSWIGRMCDM